MTTERQSPNITLNNGITIPQLGFGVFQIPPDETKKAVLTAFEAGYRHIDTAATYENEDDVGEAIKESGLARDEIFITTKCANPDQGYDQALSAYETSLEKLGIDSVDLYLIHWPVPVRDLYVDTWRALEKLYADKRVRAIGVSNFQTAHLDRLAAEMQIVPVVNQIELNPLMQQVRMRHADSDRGIATEAWSPLARGGELLADPTLGKIAEKYGKTTAQVILRWHLDLGNIVIARSVTPSRIAENFDVLDFALDQEDFDAIAPLEQGKRIGPDPDVFNGS